MKRLTQAIALMIVLTLTGAGFACSEDTKGDNKKLYTVKVVPTRIDVGKQVEVALRLEPVKGYKWNKDYPAKIKVPDVAELGLKQSEYKRKQISDDKGVGVVKFQVKAEKRGDFEIPIRANFSVCNDKVCKILNAESFSVRVHAE